MSILDQDEGGIYGDEAPHREESSHFSFPCVGPSVQSDRNCSGDQPTAPAHSAETRDDMASSGSLQFQRGRAGVPTRAANGDSGAPAEKFRLKEVDYENIVSYLEIPENFNAVTGAGRKTRVGQKYSSKATVFKAMLAVLQHHGFPKVITAPNLTKRYQRYVQRYKQALLVKMDTGGGLTEEELEAGVTLEEKLNRLCPYFERMHQVFGGRPNVAPPCTADIGVDDCFTHGEPGEAECDVLSGQENANPNTTDLHVDVQSEAGQYTPTIILESDTPAPSPADSFHTPVGGGPTPETLRRGGTDDGFWKDMEEIAREHLVDGHAPSCQCPQCRLFPGVHTGESRPVPTASATGGNPLTPIHANNNHAPQQHGRPPKGPGPNGKDVHGNSKPSFTAIYADRVNLKADYRKELIHSRDKWKSQDLADRREARLAATEREITKSKQDRKHQLLLEKIAFENASKKAKDDHEHEKTMAKEALRMAMLTTLLGSNKTPEQIKDLLPILGDH